MNHGSSGGGGSEGSTLNPVFVILIGGALWIGTAIVEHLWTVLVLAALAVVIALVRSGR